jgi:hypothetical protein
MGTSLLVYTRHSADTRHAHRPRSAVRVLRRVSLRLIAIGSWVLAVALWVGLIVWRAWIERATFKRVVPDQAFARWAA